VTCRDVIEFLIDYCDGALPQAERALFDAHLAECPDCVAYLHNYERTLKLEKAAFDSPPPEMPQALVQAIVAALRRGV
jgi:anti-sigma factor RsiW